MAETSDWAVMWAIIGVAAVVGICFIVYRLTGGTWPDDANEGSAAELGRCPYCNARMASHSRADAMECAALWHSVVDESTKTEVPSDAGD